MDLTARAFDRTRDHWWWRPGWGPGSRYLTFHLTFEHARSLHKASRFIDDELTGVTAVDLVPAEWLHLTMTGVGFVADVDDEAQRAMIETVFSHTARVATDPLHFTRAFVYPEGFGLATEPAGWLEELKAIQTEAVGKVRDVHGDGPFQPHVSLAYFSGDAPLPAIERAIRTLPFTDIVVEHPRLSLIELNRDEHVYTWKVRHQVTLGR
ncbi:2'-5' RNA ligase family protein [Microbacterium sp. HJ5]